MAWRSWRPAGKILLPSAVAGTSVALSSSSRDRYPSVPTAVPLPGPHFDSLPSFAVDPTSVKVLHQPGEWYEWLLKAIPRAKRHIFVSSLYLGVPSADCPRTVGFVDALSRAVASNPALRVTIVLDLLRSTREYPKASAASQLAELIVQYPDRVQLYLYHPPVSGWPKLLYPSLGRLIPRRLDEGGGTMHIKCYGVDDEVCLSGANLNESYFQDRQDRYIVFSPAAETGSTTVAKTTPTLASFFEDLVDSLAKISYRVAALPSSSTAATAQAPQGNFELEWPPSNPSQPPAPLQIRLPFVRSDSSSSTATLVRPDFIPAARNVMTNLLDAYSRPLQAVRHDDKVTTVQPFLQLGALAIKQETDLVVPALLQQALSSQAGGVVLDWTSGYFSLWKGYIRAILDGSRKIDGKDALPTPKIRFLCASPEANGFFGARGISWHVPGAYTWRERLFYKSLLRKGLTGSVTIDEWYRSGWTYHAKGIWLSRLSDDKASHALTYATVIGSSNFGPRSASRDLEAGVVLRTGDEDLQRRLQDELVNLRSKGTRVDGETFARPERKPSPLTKFLAWAVGDML